MYLQLWVFIATCIQLDNASTASYKPFNKLTELALVVHFLHASNPWNCEQVCYQLSYPASYLNSTYEEGSTLSRYI